MRTFSLIKYKHKKSKPLWRSFCFYKLYPIDEKIKLKIGVTSLQLVKFLSVVDVSFLYVSFVFYAKVWKVIGLWAPIYQILMYY